MSTVDSSQSSDAFQSSAGHGSHLGNRVYISSALRDLTEERKTVIDVVQRSGCVPVAMEDYGADTRPPLDRCLQDVRSCEVYIGIVAWRYGSCPPGARKSFTHLEYEEALRRGKNVLLFHLDENAARQVADVDPSRQNVQKLRGLQSKKHTVKTFSTPDDLAREVRKGLRSSYGAASSSVPELLPYTADRDRQKESFAKAVTNGDLEHSPAVVVVHGAADQSHKTFVEYLRERLLPQFLGAEDIHKIPIGLHSQDFDDAEFITRRIARECFLAPTADIDVVSRQLYESGAITALWFPVEVEVHRGRPQTRPITRLVEYFARWPPDQSLRVLPIISAQYREGEDWRSRLPWRAATSRERCARAVERATTAAANSEVLVLPELTNVERTQVMAWADQPEVHRRLGHDSEPTIRSMFQAHERSAKQRGIPMDDLARELIHLLDGSPRQEKA